MEISLYGSSGFVGSNFVRKFDVSDKIFKIARYSNRPVPWTDLLYMISTTHNYNVLKDATIDVETNLVLFTETLDSWRHNSPNGVFNFISSWFVYGNEYPAPGFEAAKKAWNDMCGEGYYTANGGASENDICNPRGFYSITKYCAEQLLRSYAETFDLKYRIIRLSNVLGKGDKKISKQKNAFQYLINELIVGNPIELYEGGKFYRDFIHVDDVCDGIKLVMSEGKTNTIYNVGSGVPTTFGDAIHMAAAKVNSVSTITDIPQPQFHKTVQAKSFYMDTQKLENLGFRARPFEETLDSILS